MCFYYKLVVMCALTSGTENVRTFFESNCDSDVLVRSYIPESVYFHCRTDKQIPVDWRFTVDEDCIYCSCVLSYKYLERFSVNASVAGENTLRVDNVTQNDAGFIRVSTMLNMVLMWRRPC